MNQNLNLHDTFERTHSPIVQESNSNSNIDNRLESPNSGATQNLDKKYSHNDNSSLTINQRIDSSNNTFNSNKYVDKKTMIKNSRINNLIKSTRSNFNKFKSVSPTKSRNKLNQSSNFMSNNPWETFGIKVAEIVETEKKGWKSEIEKIKIVNRKLEQNLSDAINKIEALGKDHHDDNYVNPKEIFKFTQDLKQKQLIRDQENRNQDLNQKNEELTTQIDLINLKHENSDQKKLFKLYKNLQEKYNKSINNSVGLSDYQSLFEKYEIQNSKLKSLLEEKENYTKENKNIKDEKNNLTDKITKIQKEKATTNQLCKEKTKKQDELELKYLKLEEQNEELNKLMTKKKAVLTNEIFQMMKLKDEDVSILKETYKAPKTTEPIHKEFDWNVLESRYKTLQDEYNNRGKIKNQHENLKQTKDYVVYKE